MSLNYSAASRTLQDAFDTRRLADRLADVTVHDRFTADDRQFIERLGMFFLATVDAAGQPTCSYTGGDPGFVAIVEAARIYPNAIRLRSAPRCSDAGAGLEACFVGV